MTTIDSNPQTDPIVEELVTAAPPAHVSTTPTSRAVKRLVRNKVAMVALGWIVFMLFVAVFAPFLAPYNPNDQLAGKFLPASSDHWLGTDHLGRDELSRLIYATRVSMLVGFATVICAVVVAVPVGLVTGYRGGWVDNVTQRTMDAFQSFPALVLALVLAFVLGASTGNLVLALVVVFIPGLVRLMRAQTLAVKEETYVEASRAIGTSTRRVLRKRILPGVTTALIVAVSIAIGGAILAEAGLAVLGLGVPPPEASWGGMLRDSFPYIFTEPVLILIPGLAIALVILAFNLLGDSINDALGRGSVGPSRRQRRKARKAAAAAGDLAAPETRGRKHHVGLTTVTIRPGEETVAVPSEGDVLAVEDLKVAFDTANGTLTVVDGVSFSVSQGEVVGIVGESGCGKSVTSLAVMRLIGSPPGRVTGGSVVFEGRDLLRLGFEKMRELRGNHLSMVFQDPMSSLDPCFTVGHQLTEAIRLHQSMRRKDAKQRAVELLELVGIPDAPAQMKEYPHRLSGGMRQRVMIAMALINDPRFLIADEPTTALDVTIQAQILELLKRLQRDLGMSMMFITHDLGVVADICDRVVVMYAGHVVEQASVADLYREPRHPYTQALLAAIPHADEDTDRLTTIPGTVPVPGNWPTGCRFAPRCSYRIDACEAAPPALVEIGDGRSTRCIRHDELRVSDDAPAGVGTA